MTQGEIHVMADLEAEAKFWMDALNNPHLKYQHAVATLICKTIENKLTQLHYPANRLKITPMGSSEDDSEDSEPSGELDELDFPENQSYGKSGEE